jgi:DNA-binding IclR family transcriptional regulator
LALDIAHDRQRLARLEKIEPQPLQRDRGEILRALLAAHGGKLGAKDARQKMRLDKATFSRLLDTLKDDIIVKPLHTDKRKMVLMLKIS